MIFHKLFEKILMSSSEYTRFYLKESTYLIRILEKYIYISISIAGIKKIMIFIYKMKKIK